MTFLLKGNQNGERTVQEGLFGLRVRLSNEQILRHAVATAKE
jgi:hypothetical protein